MQGLPLRATGPWGCFAGCSGRGQPVSEKVSRGAESLEQELEPTQIYHHLSTLTSLTVDPLQPQAGLAAGEGPTEGPSFAPC